MSRFILPDGKVVSLDQPFTIDRPIKRLNEDENEERVTSEPIQVSGGVKSLTYEDRKKLGIEEVIEQEQADQRFYWVKESNIPGKFIVEPKDIDTVRDWVVDEVKRTASGLLNQFDWMVIREASGGDPIPQAVKAYMASVRKHSNDLEAELVKLKTVEKIEAWYVQPWGWPDTFIKNNPIKFKTRNRSWT